MGDDQDGAALVQDLERDGQLTGYHPLPATHADLLRRLHRTEEAAVAYRQALALARTDAERRFLTRRLHEVAERGQDTLAGRRGVCAAAQHNPGLPGPRPAAVRCRPPLPGSPPFGEAPPGKREVEIVKKSPKSLNRSGSGLRIRGQDSNRFNTGQVEELLGATFGLRHLREEQARSSPRHEAGRQVAGTTRRPPVHPCARHAPALAHRDPDHRPSPTGSGTGTAGRVASTRARGHAARRAALNDP